MNLHTPPAPRATYQDVLDAPAHMVAELVDGRLHLHPRPHMRHAWAYSALGTVIAGPFHFDRNGPGGWWIIDEPELHLADNVLVPDLAGWRRARMPAYPDTAAVSLAPDWVCEILSPGTRAFDLGEKRGLYAAQGVAQLWLIDPEAQTLEAFALDHGRWTLLTTLAGQADVSLPPFDAITWPLGTLWPPEPDAA